MTQNDNIRYYTGTLEPVEDIDVVFKHIYDLMLANGGEDSGLNADMVDGHHASDFAPASLISEINQCIHSITVGGRRYSDNDIVLELLAKDMSLTNNNNEPVNLETFLNNLDQSTQAFEAETNSTLNNLLETTNFMSDSYAQNAISNLINNKITYIFNGSSGGEDSDYSEGEFYLNADSVNGISFSIVTQQQYDALPNEQKKDPRNIFIINNDIGESISNGSYAPPSVLQAGLNLKFKVDTDTWNVLFSIDNGTSWRIAGPLVGDYDNKGFLYPSNFEQIKEVMTADASYESNMFNQDKYPFLLNDSAAKESLLQDRAKGIQIGGNSITADFDNPILNIDSLLTNYLDNRYAQQSAITNVNSTISGNMNEIANTYQRKSNLSTSISSPGTNTSYPSTKAVVDYVNSSQNSLATTLRREISNVTLVDSGWKTVKPYSLFFNQNDNIYFRKIGKIVQVTGSVKTKTTMDYDGASNYWNLCDIPAGFQPSIDYRVVAQSSMTDRCFIFFSSNGSAQIGRFDYNNKRTGVYTLPKNYWIAFSATYFTN